MSRLMVMPLEERIVLDGAIAVDIAAVAAPEPATADPAKSHLVVVSEGVADADAFENAASDDAVVLVYDPDETDLNSLSQQINQALDGNKVQDVSFVTDGSEGFFSLVQSHSVTTQSLQETVLINFWQDVASNILPDGDVNILGCNVAGDDTGIEMLEVLDSVLDGVGYNIDVNASVDLTGHSDLGGNWTLEFSTDPDASTPINLEGTVFDSAGLSQWEHTLVSVITTTVFRDLDGNGLFDGDDIGIQGVRVNLYDSNVVDPINPFASGVLEATAITDSNGIASFTDIPAPDNYVLEYEIPIGHTVTTPDVGGNDTIDSDAATTVYDFKFVRTGVITLANNTTVTNIDAGFQYLDTVFGSVTIGDIVWNDVDQDGIQDSGEPGLNGVNVTLNGQFFLPDTSGGTPTPTFIPLITTTTPTDGSTPGDYEFKDILPLQDTFDIIFVVDSSGSTDNSFTGATVGDVNNDGGSNEVMDGQLAAISILTDDLINKGFSTGVRIGLMEFNSSASVVDMGVSGTFDTLNPTQISDGSGNYVGGANFIPSFKTNTINTITPGGSTNFGDAFDLAVDYFNAIGTQPGNGVLIFLTDGTPVSSSPWADDTAELRNDIGVDIQALGIGPGANMSTLRSPDIDPRAEQVLNEPQLFDYFNGFLSYAITGYAVEFEQLPNYEFSPQYATGATTPEGSSNDSDVNPSTGFTDVFTPVASTPVNAITEIDAGMFSPISIEKSQIDANGGVLEPGDTIIYSITVTNNSVSTFEFIDLTITDDIPTDTTLAPGTIKITSGVGSPATLTEAQGDDQAEISGNTITFWLGTGAAYNTGGVLAAGASTTVEFNVIVDDPVADQTVISNQATVQYNIRNTSDNSVTNPPDEMSNEVTETVSSLIDLDVIKSAADATTGQPLYIPGPPTSVTSAVVTNQLIRYTVTVDHDPASNTTAQNVIFTDDLDIFDSNSEYVAGSMTVDGVSRTDTGADFDGANFNAGSNVITIELGDIAPDDDEIVITFDVQVNGTANGNTPPTPNSTIDNEGTFNYNHDGSPQSESTNRTSLVVSGLVLDITKSAEDGTTGQPLANVGEIVNPGQQILYTITIDHDANSVFDADDLALTDVIDSNTTLVDLDTVATGLNIKVDGVSYTADVDDLDMDGVGVSSGNILKIDLKDIGYSPYKITDPAIEVEFLVEVNTTSTPPDGTHILNTAKVDATEAGTLGGLGTDPDFVFVVDVSGSTDNTFVGASSIGDFNNDGLTGTVMDAQLFSFADLAAQLAVAVNNGGLTSADISIVTFTGSAATLNMNILTHTTPISDVVYDPNDSGTLLSVSATADADNNGTLDVIEIIQKIEEDYGVSQAGGSTSGTDFVDAIEEADLVFGELVTTNGQLIFMSDGLSGSSVNDLQNAINNAANLPPTEDRVAIGIGQNADLTELQIIDPDAFIVTNFGQLDDFFDTAVGGQNSLLICSNTLDFTFENDVELSVTKSFQDVNGGEILPGDTILYTITVENTGSKTAYDVSLSDLINNDTTYTLGSMKIIAGFNGNFPNQTQSDLADSDQGTFIASPAEVIFTDLGGAAIGVLDAGETTTLTFEVTINNGVASGTQITNEAIAVGKDDPNNPTNDFAFQGGTQFNVGGNSELSVEKSQLDINGGTLVPGDIIRYNVVISHELASNDTAINVVLTDILDANVTYKANSLLIVNGPNSGAKTDIAGDDQAEISGNTVIFRLGTGATGTNGGTLSLAQSTEIQFEVYVNDGVNYGQTPAPSGTAITNQAVANFNEEDSGDPVTQPSPPVSITTDSVTELEVQKSQLDLNGGTLLPGDIIQYNVVVSHKLFSNDTALDVVLSDLIDPNATYKANSLVIVNGPNAGAKTDAIGDDQAEINGSTVIFRLGTGADGTNGGSLSLLQSTEIQFEVYVNDGVNYGQTPAPSGTAITNQAIATFIEEDSGDQANQPSPPVSLTTDSITELDVQKSQIDINGGALVPGDIIRYNVVVSHKPTSNDTAIDIVLSDIIDSNATYKAGSLVIVNGPNAGFKTDAIGDDQAEINGSTVIFRLGNGADGTNGGSLTLAESTEIQFEVYVNDGFNYGQAIALSGDVITNQAVATFNEEDTGDQDTQASPPVSLTVDSITELDVQKSQVDVNGGSLLPGDIIRYNVTVSHLPTSNDTAINIVLSDIIDSNATYKAGSLVIVNGPNSGIKTDISGDDQAEIIGNTVIFRLGSGADQTNGGSLALAESTEIQFEVYVNDGVNYGQAIAPSGVAITNQAVATFNEEDSGDQDTQASPPVSLTLDSVTELDVQKTQLDVNGGTLIPGDIIRYNVTVSHLPSSNDTAINIVLSDIIDSNATYKSGSLVILNGPNAGAKTDISGDDQAEISGNTVIFRLGNGADQTNGGSLALAESTEIQFEVYVNDGVNYGQTPAASGTVITNQAVAVFNEEDSGDQDTKASPPVSLTLDSVTQLNVQKTQLDVNGGALVPGDIIRYNVVISHEASSNDTAINVVLDDIIDSNATYKAGSLVIVNGANAGAKTDAIGDDQAEINGNTVTFRLGAGADGTNGGSLGTTDSTEIQFEVYVNDGVNYGQAIAPSGAVITNQAVATFNEEDSGDQDTQASPPVSLTLDSITELDVQKTQLDVNGGTLVPGDIIRYNVIISHKASSNDTAINLVLDDIIDSNATYKAGSLVIVNGANSGAKTDAAGDDQAEVNGNTVTFRLGTGADQTNGGSLGNTESTEIQFEVYVNDGVNYGQDIAPSGAVITNQAIATFNEEDTGDQDTQASPPVSLTLDSITELDVQKTQVDLNGGTLVPGDIIRYNVIISHKATSNDTAINIVLSDIIDSNATYKAGSLIIINGPNSGAKTDAIGDDQAEVNGNTVTFRLGNGADNSNGGSLSLSESTEIQFEVYVNDGVNYGQAPAPSGNAITNQAVATFNEEDTGDQDTQASPPVSLTIDSVTELDVQKTQVDVNGGTLLPGDIIRYNVIVSHKASSNDTAINIVLSDIIDSNATYKAGSLAIVNGPNSGAMTDAIGDDQGEINGNTVIFRLGNGADQTTGGSLGTTESTEIQFEVYVNDGVNYGQAIAPSGQAITNQAVATFNEEDSGDQDTQASPPVSLTLDSITELDVQKTQLDVNGGTLVPGDIIRYNVVISHKPTSNDTAINIVLTDIIDSNATYKSGSLIIVNGPNSGAKTDAPGDDQAEINGNTVVFRLGNGADQSTGGSLALAETTEIQFEVYVNDGVNYGQTPAPSGNSITNQAIATFNEEDTGDLDTQASPPVSLVLDSVTELDVQKTQLDVNGGTLVPGDIIRYNVVISHKPTSNDTAINVVLSDIIDSNATYKAGSLVIVNGANSGAKTDAIGDDQAEVNGNTVIFRLGNGADGSNGGTLTQAESTEIQFEVYVNDGVNYGQAIAPSGAVVTNQAVATFNEEDSGDQDTQASPPVSLTLDSITELDVQKTQLDINGGTLLPGDIIQYNVIISHKISSNDTAINIVLDDIIDSNATYKAGSLVIVNGPNSGAKTDAIGDDQAEINGSTVTFRLGNGADGTNGGSLSLAESTEIQFEVYVNDGVNYGQTPAPSGHPLTNQAVATFNEEDTGDLDTQASPPVSLLVDSVTELDVQKSQLDVNGGTLEPGDIIRYNVVISHKATSNDTAINVVLSDIIDSDATYKAGSLVIVNGPNSGAKTDAIGDDQAEINGNTVIFRLGNGADGSNGGSLGTVESTEIQFEVYVNDGVNFGQAPAPSGNAVTNQAVATFNEEDTGDLDTQPSAPVTLLVDSVTELDVQKSQLDVNGGTLVPGDIIRYNVVIAHKPSSNDTAINVVLSDIIDSNATYKAGSLVIVNGPNSGAKTDAIGDDQAEINGNTVIFRLGSGADGSNGGSLAQAESTEIQFEVYVNDGINYGQAIAPSAAPITNQAVATFNEEDTGDLDTQPSAPVTLLVDSITELDVQKSQLDVNGGTLVPGDIIRYNVVVSHKPTSNDTAINIVLSDIIDSKATYKAGSLVILNGPNSGAKTDAAGDDQAEVSGNSVIFRLGNGADGTNGGSLALAETTEIQFEVYVNDGVNYGSEIAPSAESVTNQAVVVFNEEDTGDQDTQPSPPVSLLIDSVTELDVVKSQVDVNGGTLLPGDIIRYNVVVSHKPTSNDTAINIVLSDIIDSNTTYKANSLVIVNGFNSGFKTDAAGDDQAEVNGNSITFRLGSGADQTNGGSLALSESTEIQFEVYVNDGVNYGTAIAPSAAPITNQAVATFNEEDTGDQDTQPSAPVTLFVDSITELDVQKSQVDINGGTLVPGDIIRYNVVVSHKITSNDTAIDIVLSDIIDSKTTYKAGSLVIVNGPNAGAKTDAAGDDQAEVNGNTVTFRLGNNADQSTGGTLALAESTEIQFEVYVNDGVNYGQTPAPASEAVTNQAVVVFKEEDTGDQDTQPSAPVSLLVDSVTELDVVKSQLDLNGGTLLPGDIIRYNVVVSHKASSNDTAINIVLSDIIDSHTTYKANSLVILNGANPGVKTDAAGDDQAEVNGNTVVFRLGNGADETNGGSLELAESTEIQFDVYVNDGVNYGSSIAPASQAITNQAVVVFNEEDTGDQDTQPSAPVTLFVDSITELDVNKTQEDLNGGTLVPGDIIKYTVVVSHKISSNDTAINIELSDILDPNVTYKANSLMIINGPNAGAKTDAAGDDQAEINGSTVTFRLGNGANQTNGGSLALAETTTITFEVYVNDGVTHGQIPAPSGAVITNQAVVVFNEEDTGDQDTQPSPPVSLNVDSVTELEVLKKQNDVNGQSLLQGNLISYTITVIHKPSSNDTAENIVLTDILPANTTYNPGSLSIISGPNAGAKTDAAGDDQAEVIGNSIVFRLGNGADATNGGTLENVESTTIYFEVYVNDGVNFGATPAPVGTAITNQGSVTFTEEDSGDIDNQPSNIVSMTVAKTPEIIVEPTEGLITTEGGGQDTFVVYLDSKPTEDVSVDLISSDLTEGVIDKLSLTFTTNNWNIPQTVTITGVDDTIDDGDIPYQVVTSTSTSADSDFNDLSPEDVSVTNLDNDDTTTYDPGITVTPITPFDSDGTTLVTTELGGVATFEIQLDTQPITDVTIPLVSSDLTEGYLNISSVTFTPQNWNIPQIVTITGVQDNLLDGNIPYTIVTEPAQTTDPTYNNLNADDVAVINIDSQIDTKGEPGIKVTPIGPLNQDDRLITTEQGGTATFDVVLNTQPTDDVTISLTSDDNTEGFPDLPTITFTPFNWNVAQTVTVTGVDDTLADGDINYDIVAEVTQTNDSLYKFIDPDDVPMINLDDGDAGNVQADVIVDPTSGLVTTEQGGTATFTVVLTTQPEFDVIIPLTSDDLTEGFPDQSSLTFTVENWNKPQTVIVTGVDDTIADGDIAYMIITGSAEGVDGSGQPYVYDSTVDDVAVTNLDDGSPGNDASPDTGTIPPGVTVTPTTGLETTETGGFDTFDVVLDTQPEKSVTITITTGDATEGTVDKQTLIFNPWDWNIPQTVTVTGVDDFIDDGNQNYTIIVDIADSNDPDPQYNPQNIDPDDVQVTNIDNDEAGLIVVPQSGLITSEDGETDTFEIFLTSQPIGNVYVNVSSLDPSEGIPEINQYTFTPDNWFAPQTDTLEGQNDTLQDGDTPYTVDVFVDNGLSQDSRFDNLSRDVAAINLEDLADLNTTFNPSPLFDPFYFLPGSLGEFEDLRNIELGTIFGDFISELPRPPFGLIYGNALPPVIISELFFESEDDENIKGWFEVYLTLKPRHPVTLHFDTINMPEGALSTDSVTFDPDDWFVVKKIYVTVDAELDVPDDETQIIVTDPAISEDSNFDDYNPQDLNVNQELEDKSLNGNDAHPQE